MVLGIAFNPVSDRAIFPRGTSRGAALAGVRLSAFAAAAFGDGESAAAAAAIRPANDRARFRARCSRPAPLGLHVSRRKTQRARFAHRGGHIEPFAFYVLKRVTPAGLGES